MTKSQAKGYKMIKTEFKKKLAAAAVAMLAAASVLCGCGSKTDGTNGADTTPAVTQPADESTYVPEVLEIEGNDHITKLMDYTGYVYSPYTDSYQGITGESYYEAFTEQYVSAERKVFVEDTEHDKTAAAVTGDGVCVKYTAYLGEEEVKDLSAEINSFTIGSKTVIEGLENSVIGHVPGDEYEVVVSYPETYTIVPEVSGKDVTYKVTFNYYAKEEEVTQENAYKIVYGYDTYEECIKDMQEYIDESRESGEKNYQDNLITTFAAYLVQYSEFNENTDELDAYFETYYAGEEKYYADMGYDMETIAEYYNCESVDELKETMRKVADTTIKKSYIADLLAEREEIDVTDEKLSEHAEEMIEETGKTVEEYTTMYNSYYGEGAFEEEVRVDYILQVVFDEYAKLSE